MVLYCTRSPFFLSSMPFSPPQLLPLGTPCPQRSTIKKRRQKFELYLQELLLLQPRPVELNAFLAIP